jgi:uncharacterized membrane protein
MMSVLVHMRYLADVAVKDAQWATLAGPIAAALPPGLLRALTASMVDVGISDDLIRRLRQDVVPGTSALFVLSSDAVLDRVRNAFEAQPELLFTNLSAAGEDRLREVFSG